MSETFVRRPSAAIRWSTSSYRSTTCSAASRVGHVLAEQSRVGAEPLLVQTAECDDRLVECLAGDEPRRAEAHAVPANEARGSAGCSRQRESPAGASSASGGRLEPRLEPGVQLEHAPPTVSCLSGAPDVFPHRHPAPGEDVLERRVAGEAAVDLVAQARRRRSARHARQPRRAPGTPRRAPIPLRPPRPRPPGRSATRARRRRRVPRSGTARTCSHGRSETFRPARLGARSRRRSSTGKRHRVAARARELVDVERQRRARACSGGEVLEQLGLVQREVGRRDHRDRVGTLLCRVSRERDRVRRRLRAAVNRDLKPPARRPRERARPRVVAP